MSKIRCRYISCECKRKSCLFDRFSCFLSSLFVTYNILCNLYMLYSTYIFCVRFYLIVVLQTTRPQMTVAGDGRGCYLRAKWCYSNRSPITVNGYQTADFLPCTSVGGKSSPPDPCPTRMRRRYWTTFTTAKSRLEC